MVPVLGLMEIPVGSAGLIEYVKSLATDGDVLGVVAVNGEPWVVTKLLGLKVTEVGATRTTAMEICVETLPAPLLHTTV